MRQAEHKKFSAERLIRIRRLRKARRLFKKMPLFAYEYMKLEYPGYTPDEFRDDLRLRRKPKVRQLKNNAIRFGRYQRIDKLLVTYKETGDVTVLLEADKLYKRLRKPYNMMVKIGKYRYQFTFPATVTIDRIEKLSAAFAACSSPDQVEALHKEFMSTLFRS